MPHTPARLSEPFRLGLWGMSDLDCFGPALTARICRHEIARRLPEADIRVFAPYGHLRPVRSDGGDPAEPLGRWTERRRAELAEALDCVVVVGDLILDDDRLSDLYGVGLEEAREMAAGRFLVEGLGTGPDVGGATLWHSVDLGQSPDDVADGVLRAVAGHGSVTVRDGRSRRRLAQAGVERTIAIAPDPLLFLPRLLPPALLAKRLAYLRAMRWYPHDGPALVVQRGQHPLAVIDDLVAALADIVDDHGRPAVVVAELAPHRGDRGVADANAFADAVVERLPVRVYRLPPVASQEDVVAAIAGSIGFVGTSRSAATTARAYRRPGVVLEPGAGAAPDQGLVVVDNPAELRTAFADATASVPGTPSRAEIEADVDAAFDQVAAAAAEAAARRQADHSPAGPSDDPAGRIAERAAREAAWRRAHEVRGERVVAERVAFADRVTDLEAELAAERAALADATEQIRQLEVSGADTARKLEETELELSALRMTRTFRWTASARAAYGRACAIVRRQ